MLTKWLTACGFTRDWAGWLWLRVLAIAPIIADGTLDLSYWSHYLGVPLSETAIHRLIAVASVVLWIAGKQAHSGLPSKAELQSVKVPTGGV